MDFKLFPEPRDQKELLIGIQMLRPEFQMWPRS